MNIEDFVNQFKGLEKGKETLIEKLGSVGIDTVEDISYLEDGELDGELVGDILDEQGVVKKIKVQFDSDEIEFIESIKKDAVRVVAEEKAVRIAERERLDAQKSSEEEEAALDKEGKIEKIIVKPIIRILKERKSEKGGGKRRKKYSKKKKKSKSKRSRKSKRKSKTRRR